MGAPVSSQHGLVDEGAENVPIGDNTRPVVTLFHQFPVDGSDFIHHLLVEGFHRAIIRQPAYPDHQTKQWCGGVNQAVMFQPPELELLVDLAFPVALSGCPAVGKNQITERTAAGIPAAVG